MAAKTATALAVAPRSRRSGEAGPHFANLDGGPFGRGAFLGPGAGFAKTAAIEQEVTADEFLGLGEGSIDEGRFAGALVQRHRLALERVDPHENAARLEFVRVVDHALIERLPLLERTVIALPLRFNHQQ